MAIDHLKELELAQAKVVELKNRIVEELASLPAKYGYESITDFFKAVKEASESVKPTKRKATPAKKAAPKAKKTAAKSRGRGARISDEVRAEVKKLTEAGVSGAQIAKQLGISLPSVQNIKKGFGLVKARGARKAAAPAVAPSVAPAPVVDAAPATPAS